MEFDCAPVKRRRMLPPHRVNHSESNKEPNLLSPNESRNTSLACLDEAHATLCPADILNAEAVVKQDDTFDDEKESLMEGSQIERFDLDQESYEGKNKILMEDSGEPKSSSNVNVMCDVYTNEGKTSVEIASSSHPIDQVAMSIDSKMDAIHSSTKLGATKESDSQVRNEDNIPLQISGSCWGTDLSHSRKKLLVLDVNGLLVDIVADPDEAYKADTIIGSKAVFKRPYCDEFLKFCFERFNVGVWTSRTRRNIERVLDFLIRDTQHQLLFCWDQSHCTETGFNTIENSAKPLVLKELKRLWEKQDPNLPWDRGVYDESNTLLLDDSPYKALRNPPNTAIFPYTYCYRDTEDNGLGPEGDLRNYLDRLATSDNVQKFIEQNPFGQQPITYNNESWKFYLKVIGATSSETGPSRSRKKLIVIDVGGLLVDVVILPREGFRADLIQGSRAVFKRPYCDEFLQFCFERFNVGIWTSTTRRNVERVLDFLMRDTQHKLLFCWDQTHCTDTGFRTVENSSKSLILKELRRLWEKQDPNLPWDMGEYDQSNTLLLENSPHKALLNPPHTAIFPYPYRYWKTEDNSLGPDGDLRVYLEKIAASENVQKFVEENPFGQRPITKKNLSWGFYQKVIRAFSSEPEANTTTSVAQILSEPEANTTTSVTQKMSEPEANTTSVSVAQVLSEPEANTTSVSVAQILSEAGDPTTASVAQILSESETETINGSVAQILSEPEANATQSLSGPEAETITVSAAQTLPNINPSLEAVNDGSSIGN